MVEGSAEAPAAQVCARIYLFFLAFVLYQSLLSHQGYYPFHEIGWVNPVFRTLTVAGVFLGGLALLLPERWRWRALLWAVIAAGFFWGFYFAVVISNIPMMADCNDRSEALQIAIWSLLKGDFPYLQPTLRGGPVTALTTSIVIALPAELIWHRPELMNLPILVLLWGLVVFPSMKRGREERMAWASVLIFLNPIVVHEMSIGSDLIWGSVLVLVGLRLLEKNHLRVAAVVMGLGICTRANFLYLVPLILVHLGIQHRRRGVLAGGVLLATMAVLELPFMIWNWDMFLNFAPLAISTEKISAAMPPGDNYFGDTLNSVLPVGPLRGEIITALMVTWSVALGWRARGVRDLEIMMAALLTLPLLFMGAYFLFDYLIMAVPFVLSVALRPGSLEKKNGESAEAPSPGQVTG